MKVLITGGAGFVGSFIATKFVDGDSKKGVAFQRPLCPYPQVAMYKGSGNMNDAANFACQTPK